MLFASKIGCSGIVFILLTTWISGPRRTPIDSGVNLSREATADTPGNDIKKTQQTLQDRGQYHGKIDGVPGLRTRASIRGFQKAESLPVTGQLDAQTADKLAVRPEVREETRHETTQDKPSAGIKWTRGSGRTSKTPRQLVKKSAPPQSGWKDGEKSLQAENDNHLQ
jgi:peptidoglycan hydrolase-like protein with peptidoglycan-binding domain